MVVLVLGTIGFHESLSERWGPAFYRTVVTISLAGLDTGPRTDAARAISIVLVLAGITIFAYVATILVEGIARGVFTDALAERRRRRTIERLRDHYIICGYGRVGRRVAGEFRESGEEYVVLDFSTSALEAAREAGDLFIEGTGTEMAKLVLRPQVAAFLDIVSTHGGPELRFDEIEVGATENAGESIRGLR